MNTQKATRGLPNPKQVRRIKHRDVVVLIGQIMADPRISSTAAFVAIAILQHVDIAGCAMVSDDLLERQSASKITSQKLRSARDVLRRTNWVVWTPLGDGSNIVYLFPSLGRLIESA